MNNVSGLFPGSVTYYDDLGNVRRIEIDYIYNGIKEQYDELKNINRKYDNKNEINDLYKYFKSKENKKNEVSENNKPDLELVESSIINDEYNSYITSVIKNNSSKTFGYVQVEINLYDNKNIQIGSTIDNVNNLESNNLWKFKAIVNDKTVFSYKIVDISSL